eukprot:8533673-Pyramimonas_sp.AAC.1
MRNLAEILPDQDVVVVFVCRSGRRRSVACACALKCWLRCHGVGREGVGLSVREWPQRTCCGCFAACPRKDVWAKGASRTVVDAAVGACQKSYNMAVERREVAE